MIASGSGTAENVASVIHKTYLFYSPEEVLAMTLGSIDGNYGTHETLADGLRQRALDDVRDWLAHYDPDEITERKTSIEWDGEGITVRVSLGGIPGRDSMSGEPQKMRFRVKLTRDGNPYIPAGSVGLLEPVELSIHGDVIQALFYPGSTPKKVNGYGLVIWPAFELVEYAP